MLNFELNLLKYIESIRTDLSTAFFEGITMLGEETILIVLMAVIYFMFNKNLARRIFFITAISLSFNGAVKNFVKRPRPFVAGDITPVRAETATGYSFPSGHTQTFATGSFAFAFHLKKRWLFIIAIIFTCLIAFSRMYLGVHYPSDVIFGALAGVSFASGINHLCDKVKDMHKLHGGACIVLLPFAVFFLIKPDGEYADFFKIYGLLTGLFISTLFEEKYVNFTYETPIFKKLLRVVIGVILAFIFKEGLKMLFATSFLPLSLIFDCLRYIIIVFVIMGICPLVFKKLNI